MTVAAVLLALAVLLWPHPPRPVVPPAPEARTVPRAGAAAGHRRRWARPRRHRADRRDVEEVLALLDALGPALRAGLPPGDALRAAAPDGPSDPAGVVMGEDRPAPQGTGAVAVEGHPVSRLLRDLLRAADRGEPLSLVWRDGAERGGSSDLTLVASAWELCERLGAPLASTVTTVASVVRRRVEVERRAAAALAGPRASMVVLTALPLAGPLLALVMGLSPVDLYASPPGAAALGVGLVLLLVGRWWGARLVRSIGQGGSRG